MQQRISKNNDIIKNIRKQQRKTVEKDLLIIEDLFIFSLVLKHNYKIETVLYCDELEYKNKTQDILNKLKNKATSIYTISKSTFDSIKNKNNSVGIILLVRLQTLNIDKISLNKYNRILVADGLEIPGNLGTIYRTADAVGFDLIININSVTHLANSKTLQSSRGMILTIPTVNTTYETLKEKLLESKHTIYLAEPELGESCFNTKFNEHSTFVVGSERFGIAKDWYNNKHTPLFVPMSGEMGSLNVGVAASVVMYCSKFVK